jgi:hypothetical protein
MIMKLGDKNEVHARKKGMVQLNGVCIEVFFVPEFRISLLSVSQLDFYGLTAIFKNGTCTVIDHLGNNALSATLDGGLYYIILQSGSLHISSAAPILPPLESVHTSSSTKI